MIGLGAPIIAAVIAPNAEIMPTINAILFRSSRLRNQTPNEPWHPFLWPGEVPVLFFV